MKYTVSVTVYSYHTGKVKILLGQTESVMIAYLVALFQQLRNHYKEIHIECS